MAHGLLAYLGPRLTKQQELLATEGLTYLLQTSDACAGALRRLAHQADCTLPLTIAYRAEVAGDGLERPDVVGIDADMKEVAIIEGKFFAGLTDNQPAAYLRRLAPENGLLLFVVPARRMTRLWSEVRSRVENGETVGPTQEFGGAVVHATIGDGRVVMMVSWDELLDRMMAAARAAAEDITADIVQLHRLCQRIEGEAFLPFSSEELTSLTLPRRHRDFCDLVDAVVDACVATGDVSLSGMRATPQRNGYIRYLTLNSAGAPVPASVDLNYSLWLETEMTPIWLGSQRSGVGVLRQTYRALAAANDLHVKEIGGLIYLSAPVRPLLEFDEMVKETADLVRTVIHALPSTA